ncbi:MAG TPA: acyltransferase [Solimonas sp.]|nr:acyltransferase [Solimonas sp.]
MSVRNNYIKGLDSVRAISMVLVLLVHLRLLGIGWITIQTFFVMSGFLITRILLSLREKHALGSYLKIFYARRTLRIFPIFYLTLVVLLALTLVNAGMDDVQAQSPYALAYVWNWFAILHQGPTVHYLGHFWSLAVEEQFYLAWPLLVFFARGAWFWRIAAGIVLAGPLVRLASALIWPHVGSDLGVANAIYLMSTTHLDAFATGALLCAVIQHPASRRFQPWHLLLAALAVYALGVMTTGVGIGRGGPYNVPLNLGYPIHMAQHWQFVWGYTVLNLLSAGLLLLVGQGRFLNPVFQHPLLTRLGVITYGAYVIHLPLMHLFIPMIRGLQQVIGSPYWSAWLSAPVLIVATFSLAELSYRFFESRFLRLKDSHFSSGAAPAAPAPPAVAASAVVAPSANGAG